jgi:hypothetical protein
VRNVLGADSVCVCVGGVHVRVHAPFDLPPYCLTSTEPQQPGSHSQGQAKEAHVGTERDHDIYNIMRFKRALPPHTQPIARHPASAPIACPCAHDLNPVMH